MNKTQVKCVRISWNTLLAKPLTVIYFIESNALNKTNEHFPKTMCWLCQKTNEFARCFFFYGCVEFRDKVLRHSVNVAHATHFASKCRSFQSLSLSEWIQFKWTILAFAHNHTKTHIVRQSFKWIQMFVSAQPKKSDVEEKSKMWFTSFFRRMNSEHRRCRRLPF